MKKVAILCMIVALAFAVSGATCRSQVQTLACNPPADVMAVANAVIIAILPQLNLMVPGSASYNSYITADSIAAGVCVSVVKLDALIAWLQSPDAQVMHEKAMTKAGPMKAQALNIAPLQAWAATFK